jgi:hypothetical protein
MLERQLGNDVTRSSGEIVGHVSSWEHSHLPLKLPDSYHVEFPVTYFLDHEVYKKISPNQLNPGFAVPAEMLHILHSKTAIHSLCNTYMSTIQTWLPILSKKRIFQSVQNFNETKDAPFTLLLLSMKLACEIPPEQDHAAKSLLYCMTKGYQSHLETSGVVSLQLLQSNILIAIYEIGHGIYPAGYLSVTHAARLGIMMGLHDKKGGTGLFKDAQTWTQCEEERRSWWAVFLLERYVCKDVYQDVTDTACRCEYSTMMC